MYGRFVQRKTARAICRECLLRMNAEVSLAGCGKRTAVGVLPLCHPERQRTRRNEVKPVSRSPEAAEGKRVCQTARKGLLEVRIYKGSEFTLEGLRPEGRSDLPEGGTGFLACGLDRLESRSLKFLHFRSLF
jgi:hypothetical protein